MSFSIPYGKQEIDDNDISSVIKVLKSEYLTQGPLVNEFEMEFAKYVGSKYAVAVSNGTTALHLSALCLGVNESSKVITTPITFSASANCIEFCNGEVAFVDIDPCSYLMDLKLLKKVLQNSSKGEFSGIVAVDFAGRSMNMQELKNIADEYGLWIIEDACHAPGAFFYNSEGVRVPAGSCQFTDVAIFSFHPVKHIAAGEGGMITTNDFEIYKKLIELRSHGITRDQTAFVNSKSIAFGSNQFYSANSNYPGWYMEMKSLGYNYRLTDMQCALGLSQLLKADTNLKRRREIAKTYDNFFSNYNFLRSSTLPIDGHAYHLYVIETDDRNELYEFLKKRGIYTQVHYIPIHLMPYYQSKGWELGDFPNAERYYERCLSLPMYPSLSEDELNYIFESFKLFFNV